MVKGCFSGCRDKRCPMEIGGPSWQTGSGRTMFGIAKYPVDMWIDHYSGVPQVGGHYSGVSQVVTTLKKGVEDQDSLLGSNLQRCAED
eukprot:10542860-Prorocentrum_lima.AAC.1